MNDFFKIRVQNARKNHKCDFCGLGECPRIRKSDSYMTISGVYDGQFGHHKCCSKCAKNKFFTEIRKNQAKMIVR